jgi:hypothetical protein
MEDDTGRCTSLTGPKKAQKGSVYENAVTVDMPMRVQSDSSAGPLKGIHSGEGKAGAKKPMRAVLRSSGVAE